MKIRMWALKRVTERNGNKIDTSKLTWNDWSKKLNEEVDELSIALHSKNKAAIEEEVMDVVQICIAIIVKLFKDGTIIEQIIRRHNKKLNDRGCEISAEIKFDVNRK